MTAEEAREASCRSGMATELKKLDDVLSHVKTCADYGQTACKPRSHRMSPWVKSELRRLGYKVSWFGRVSW